MVAAMVLVETHKVMHALLAQGILSLYEKQQFYDLVLVVGIERFPAHRSMLAAMSSNFREYLRQTPGAADPMKGMLAPVQPQQFRERGGSSCGEDDHVPEKLDLAQEPMELQVNGLSNPESMKLMLYYVYRAGTGATWEYCPTSAEVNKDMLRLARHFGFPHVQEVAARWLTNGLNTGNVVERLVTCDEFGLGLLLEKIIQKLTANPAELIKVCSSPEIVNHPRVLQTLLMQVTSLHGVEKQQSAEVGERQQPAEVGEMKQQPEKKLEKDGNQVSDEEAERHPKQQVEKSPEKKHYKQPERRVPQKSPDKHDLNPPVKRGRSCATLAPEKPAIKRVRKSLAGA